MGIYSEYMDRGFSFPELTQERKKQLGRISEQRDGRAILVIASELSNSKAPIAIDYTDLLPINDQIANLSGDRMDVLLETPGGSGEVAEDVVNLLRSKFREVAFIVPGWAKSAGTIVVMAGDEILMGQGSALGPIDAQMTWQGKTFSAGELIDGMDKIKKEVVSTGVLNKAYIPILQGLSPGELQRAENSQLFAKTLVKEWLVEHKFKNWTTHSSDGRPVSEEERGARAEEIADKLGDHSCWRTHGRSIRIRDLEEMRLSITDYSKQPDLADAIRRYHVLLQMTFGTTSIYKLFETRDSQIYRFLVAQGPVKGMGDPDKAVADIPCDGCKTVHKVQANLRKGVPLKLGCLPFPADNKLKCQECGREMNLTAVRRQIEMQAKKPLVF